MTKLLPLLFLIGLKTPEKVDIIYLGNDSSIVIGTFRKACIDSVRMGLKEYCEPLEIKEVKKFKKD